MKRLTIFLIIQLLVLLVIGQDTTITLTVQPPFYTGTDLMAMLKVLNPDTSRYNSLIFRNGVQDTSYRYFLRKLAKQNKQSGQLMLGSTDFPGPKMLELDIIANSLESGGRPDSVYARYKAFLHPVPDNDCQCDNTDHPYPLALQRSPAFGNGDWLLLDSLITRMQVDDVNASLGNNFPTKLEEAQRCDTVMDSSWQMALILTVSSAGPENTSLLSIVIDTLGSNASVDSQRMVNSCVTVFNTQILDTTSNGPVKNTLSAASKWALQSSLMIAAGTPTTCDVYFSRGFVRQMWMLANQIDIRHVCKKLRIYRKTGVYNQLIWLMKIPPPR